MSPTTDRAFGILGLLNAGNIDLCRSADEVDLGEGLVVEVAHPRDLLRLADASPRDRARLPGLRALLDLHGKAATGR